MIQSMGKVAYRLYAMPHHFILFILLSFNCCPGSTLWHLQKFLQCITVEFTPAVILLYPPFPHSWNGFNRSHFSIFIQEYIVFPLYSSSHPFLISPPTLVPTPERTCFTFLFSVFEKRRFCLRQLYGVFHCNISMYYNPN
jgi:hypothetical protein